MDSNYLDSIEREVDSGKEVFIFFSGGEEDIPSPKLVTEDLEPDELPYFVLPGYYDKLKILHILTHYFRSYRWCLEVELENDEFRIYGYLDKEGEEDVNNC